LSAANQAKLLANVEAYVPRMSEVALQIWKMPELGYQENQNHRAAYKRDLKSGLYDPDRGGGNADRLCRQSGNE
jgi:hypothetical protein